MRGKIKIDVLNAQTGHTSLTFDKNNLEEVRKASKQINDMLRMGYAIFVESGGATKRITSFDVHINSYMIGDIEAAPSTAHATAIAPSAGGCLVK